MMGQNGRAEKWNLWRERVVSECVAVGNRGNEEAESVQRGSCGGR